MKTEVFHCDRCNEITEVETLKVIPSRSYDGVEMSDDVVYADACPKCLRNYVKLITMKSYDDAQEFIDYIKQSHRD